MKKGLLIARNVLYTLLICIIFVTTAIVINYAIIEKLIIPDRGNFDEATGKVFDLFYDISSNTGYNVETSLFNGIFTITIGILIGILYSYKTVWRKI